MSPAWLDSWTVPDPRMDPAGATAGVGGGSDVLAMGAEELVRSRRASVLTVLTVLPAELCPILTHVSLLTTVARRFSPQDRELERQLGELSSGDEGSDPGSSGADWTLFAPPIQFQSMQWEELAADVRERAAGAEQGASADVVFPGLRGGEGGAAGGNPASQSPYHGGEGGHDGGSEAWALLRASLSRCEGVLDGVRSSLRETADLSVDDVRETQRARRAREAVQGSVEEGEEEGGVGKEGEGEEDSREESDAGKFEGGEEREREGMAAADAESALTNALWRETERLEAELECVAPTGSVPPPFPTRSLTVPHSFPGHGGAPSTKRPRREQQRCSESARRRRREPRARRRRCGRGWERCVGSWEAGKNGETGRLDKELGDFFPPNRAPIPTQHPPNTHRSRPLPPKRRSRRSRRPRSASANTRPRRVRVDPTPCARA